MNKTWKAYCPLMKGVCLNGFVKGMPESETGERTVCAFFIQLAGKNPQTDEVINDPGCSIHFLPIIQLEGNNITRQAVASTDKVATNVHNHHKSFMLAIHGAAKRRTLEATADELKRLSDVPETPPIGGSDGNGAG
jgi:hypothetical protein